MKKSRFYGVFLFLLCVLPGFAQQKFTLSGFIRDAKTGENLIGATITIKELHRGKEQEQTRTVSIPLRYLPENTRLYQSVYRVHTGSS